MAYTFTQAQQELWDRGFNYMSVDANGIARTKAFLNAAYREVASEEPWPFLEASAAGAAPLTIADLGSIESVTNISLQNKLTPVDRRSLSDAYPVLTTPGTAAFYYVTLGTVVNVYPLDASSITVLYWKLPATLSAGGDTMVIPDPYQELVILAAMRRAFGEDTDAADVAANVQEYGLQLQKMRDEFLDVQEDRPAMIAQTAPHEGW